MSQSESVKDQASLSVETVVAGTPQEVLDYVAELRHMERWWPQHWRYRRLSGDGGPGTRYYWIFVGMGAILPGITTIDIREPGRLGYRTALAGLPVRIRYQFSAAPGGTLMRGEMSSPGLRFGIFRWAVGKQMREAFALLAGTETLNPLAG